MNNYGYLGVVENGRFKPLVSDRDTADSLRLTSISPQAAQSPEGGEYPLTEYEQMALMVRGIDQGEWIYSAVIVDKGGPIITALVRKVLVRPVNKIASSYNLYSEAAG